jgi:hypothetical protein
MKSTVAERFMERILDHLTLSLQPRAGQREPEPELAELLRARGGASRRLAQRPQPQENGAPVQSHQEQQAGRLGGEAKGTAMSSRAHVATSDLLAKAGFTCQLCYFKYCLLEYAVCVLWIIDLEGNIYSSYSLKSFVGSCRN